MKGAPVNRTAQSIIEPGCAQLAYSRGLDTLADLATLGHNHTRGRSPGFGCGSSLVSPIREWEGRSRELAPVAGPGLAAALAVSRAGRHVLDHDRLNVAFSDEKGDKLGDRLWPAMTHARPKLSLSCVGTRAWTSQIELTHAGEPQGRTQRRQRGSADRH